MQLAYKSVWRGFTLLTWLLEARRSILSFNGEGGPATSTHLVPGCLGREIYLLNLPSKTSSMSQALESGFSPWPNLAPGRRQPDPGAVAQG